MTQPPESGDVDPRLARALGEFDEALAAGNRSAFTRAEMPADLADELAEAEAVVKGLERLWPRSPRPADTPEPAVTALDGTVSRPQTFGRFQIKRKLGQGGMGIVLLAHDPGLHRDVALKLPRPDVLVSDDRRRRFANEARAAAGLDHPNIVQLYEVGEVGGVAYLASAYCLGPSLAEWLRQRTAPVPCRQAARLVAQLADAVAHMHDRHVLHRDIKPANVLLASGGREPTEASSPEGASLPLADLTPKLTDFGLAMLVEGVSRHTATGVILGTAAYMPPEQAEGRVKAIGPATDVYALGAVLYELLTGQPPFAGETDLEIRRQVSGTEPVPPRHRRRGVPRDLETICLKCLEKAPARRYGSARELANDLASCLAGEAIKARPVGVGERALRWARRHPTHVTAAALVLGFVALLALLNRPPLRSTANPGQVVNEAEDAYQKAVQVPQRALAEGQAITLIGPGAPELTSRWRTESGKIEFPQAEAKGSVVSLHAPLAGMLELLSDPQGMAYRIEAELRHDSALAGAADVGLYFGYTRHQTEEGVQHFFGSVSFADLGFLSRAFRDAQKQPCSACRLLLRHLGDTHTGISREWLLEDRYFIAYPVEPEERLPRPWRKVRVDVRPDNIRLTWESRAIELKPGNVMPDWVFQLRMKNRDLRRVDIKWTPRGAIGIWVNRGSASVRRLVVEPLGGQPGK
jgi:hypothetical protein